MTIVSTEHRMAGLSSGSHDSGAGEGPLVGHGSLASVWPDFLVGQTDHPVRVLLVDDDAHIRLVIAQELMADPRTLVVAQASSLREGRKAIKQHEFDVLLVDLHLGDGEGFELLDYLKTVRPSAEAVVISVMENEDEVLRAFELGATGYLGKNSWFGNYAQAVLQVVNGGASITPTLARRLLQRFDKTHADPPRRQEPAEAELLSDREKDVLRMVAGGYTTAEIATNLRISTMTVNTHIRNIYRKLQVRTRAQAVRFASLRGLF
ncbi:MULTISPECIES: LuxR C-terminal-related transcriptional regulator [Acidovorax]|uniref:DNA-binding response regulator, NarL/FixJ family, contains REC and HTH domains n=1 Tax=Acidovorax soli TaxID=592050 RepID=A0A1H4EH74_9BURK|nr:MULTISPECIES: response regulator transcription factor [Acidovorax]SEA83940.1 DNA-binding response regulator, NarL/FixJ family, contains REC and HTH domains [Acidovorax soli]